MLKSILKPSNPGNPPVEEKDPLPIPNQNQPPPSSPIQPIQPIQPAAARLTNILSNGVEIVGNIKFDNELTIDGIVEGNVTSNDGILTIGENARIKGEIQTRSVIMFGIVEGNLAIKDRCVLRASCKLMGNVKTGTLAVEEGAVFLGTSKVVG